MGGGVPVGGSGSGGGGGGGCCVLFCFVLLGWYWLRHKSWWDICMKFELLTILPLRYSSLFHVASPFSSCYFIACLPKPLFFLFNFPAYCLCINILVTHFGVFVVVPSLASLRLG